MVKITINTGNDAFSENNRGYEIARILNKIALDFEINGAARGSYNDANGNKAATVEEDGR